MRRRYSVKPGRVQSALGFIIGIIFICIGLFGMLPKSDSLGSFGKQGGPPIYFVIVWLLIAVFNTIYFGYNFFSQKGLSFYKVEIDEDTATSDTTRRLQELEKLKEKNLINTDEYTRKREEILNKL